MGQLTNAGRNLVLDSGVPNTLYLALSSSAPALDGTNITEPAAGDYARQSVTMGAAANAERLNTNPVNFSPTSDWGTFGYGILFTAVSGGTAVDIDALDGTYNMVNGSDLDISVGSLSVGFTGGAT